MPGDKPADDHDLDLRNKITANMKKSVLILIICVVISPFTPGFAEGSFPDDVSVRNHEKLALVTYASDNVQVKHVKVLVESLRQYGGIYSASSVYVVIADTLVDSEELGNNGGVFLLNLLPDALWSGYPFAVKAFAAALAEREVGESADYIAWFDPETIILSEPDGLVPDDLSKAVVQPVFLSNTIGLPPGNEPDDFWEPVYRAAMTNCTSLPVVETLIDRQRIIAYYNCEVFSVRSNAGIMRSWAETMGKLLSDSLYSYGVCNTPQRRTFLHQAALSAVISRETSGSAPALLPLSNGYPLHMHRRIMAESGTNSIDNIACAILEEMWVSDPSWLDSLTTSGTTKVKLSRLFFDFMEVAPGIYRQEGSCNSYLVITGDSSILIDPAGVSSHPSLFRDVIRKYPLSLILLTHGHNDHRDNTDLWSEYGSVPVIAQRGIRKLIDYQQMLSGFFRRRNAIWSGKPVYLSGDTIVSNPVITRYYDDSLTLKAGTLTIRIWHTSGETPDHSLIYIPEKQSVFVGDNYYSSFPNIYTLRGTKPRWATEYIYALDMALAVEPVFLFPGHGTWLRGKKQVDLYAGGYRNAISYIHNETVRGMNAGIDRYTLMKEIKLPPEYSYIDQSYGTVKWSVRGIYEGYAGWFDEKPSSMYDQPGESIGGDLIDLAGERALLDLVRAYIVNKDYIRGLHLVELIIAARPGLEEALALKRTILNSLKSGSTNYIERIWLNYGLSQCNGLR